MGTGVAALQNVVEESLCLPSSVAVSETEVAMEQSRIDQRVYLSGGELLPWGGASQQVETPYLVDGAPESVGSYPLLTKAEALAAAESAATAYAHGLGVWPTMTIKERAACVADFVDKMVLERDAVSFTIMQETAKPLALCYKEFDRTVDYIRRTVAAALTLEVDDSASKVHPEGLETHIERTPLGPTLCLGPFNYPLNETFTSLIPALIMGNPVVMKPARFGVLLFEPLLAAFRDSFPPGVVNIVYGDGQEVVLPIIESGKMDVLAFIGSTRVANILARAHPEPHRLTRILGLGAHNPAIILPSVDIDSAIPELVAGSLTFNGQRCTTLAIHFVPREKGEEYAERFADAANGLKFGDPRLPGVQITALAEGERKIEYLQELIKDAVSKGARIVNEDGGTVVDGIMIPAVLYPVTSAMRIFSEEQFGPIVPISPYDSVSDVIETVAASRFGQQMSVFGTRESEVQSILPKLRVLGARVNINCQSQRGPDELPFTGKKDSGLGVLSIVDALKAFSCPTVISRKI